MILVSGLLGGVLLRLAVIDLRSFRLPDIYTLPLIMVGIGVNWVQMGRLPHGAIWGAVIGYAAFWVIGSLFYRRFGNEGLGLGDAKLFAASGAWVGLVNLPYVLLVAALGALLSAGVAGQARGAPIAFGPWLAIAFWLVWIFETLFSIVQ